MNHMQRREQLRGIALTIIGGIFWGLAGVCGQYLFEERDMTAKWLVSVRLVTAGLLLLATVWAKQRKQMFAIWKEKRDIFQLIMFGLFGMAFCQLTYYVAVESSNAGTATVLQYTAPIIIMVYVSVRKKKMPSKTEILALVLAVGGTFLLATHGNITSLAISTKTLAWGLAAAVAMALYNLIPGELMKKFGTFNVIGWGMLIGGIFLCIFIQPWHVEGTWDIYTVLAISAVILVGTILSFATYMEGVRLIGASKASLFASVEPVTATFMTVVFMGAPFMFMDFVGLLCILGAVLMLSLLKKD